MAAPGQLFAEGVTVIVAVTGALLTLIVVNAGISPLPLAPKPMEVLSLVQVKVVLLTAPEKFTAVVAVALHTDWSAGLTTVGVGFTVIIKLCEGPLQPFADGEIVMSAVAGTVPVFIATKDAIFPVPLAGKPIEGLSFVQLKLVPLTAPEKLMEPVAALLQTARSAGLTTFGVGFTVIVNVLGVPGQMPLEGVTRIVATAFTLPALTAVKGGISPLPLAAKPIAGLLFVHVKEVPLTVPENVTGLVASLLQSSWFAGCTTFGEGLTVMVKISGAPVQVR